MAGTEDRSWKARRDRFGQRVREARDRLGWDQETLAREVTAQLADQTVGQGMVSRWERGLAAPRPEKLPVIEQVLRLAPGELEHVLFPPSANGSGAPAALSGKWNRLSEEDRRYVEGLVNRLLGEEDR